MSQCLDRSLPRHLHRGFFAKPTFSTSGRYLDCSSVNTRMMMFIIPFALSLSRSQAATAQPAIFRYIASQPSVDMYATDSLGNTALHIVVAHGLVRMYDFICELWKQMYKDSESRRQGRPSLWRVRNSEGLTPLQFAAKLGKKEVFEHILEVSTGE